MSDEEKVDANPEGGEEGEQEEKPEGEEAAAKEGADNDDEEEKDEGEEGEDDEEEGTDKPKDTGIKERIEKDPLELEFLTPLPEKISFN